MTAHPALEEPRAASVQGSPRARQETAYELAVVVPTLNEAGNIRPLLKRLDQALRGIAWEVIFVDDDSPDGTSELVRETAAVQPNVRGLRRIGRRGLSSACIEGMLATSAPYIAVMDADLQHDERLLGPMLARLKSEGLDIVVASRFVDGGSLGSFSRRRERLSRLGNRISRLISRVELSDPMSGYFMLRREVLDEVVHELSGKGFKLLLDLFSSAPRPLRFAELPLCFRPRHSGTSKLDTLVALEFATLLADKTLGRVIPVRFVLFVLVGLFGILVHLAALGLAFKGLGLGFAPSQVLATATAMTVNFFLNNQFTYRDRRLVGRELVRGLISFYLACSLGALVNVFIAKTLFDLGTPWALAGMLGATSGAVWNYAMTRTFTWRSHRAER
jgi:dolichol-phosphate mannosyltransferase